MNTETGKHLTANPSLAILVVANQVDPKIIERFLWGIRNSEKNIPFDIFLGSHSSDKEAFRKTTILNDMIRQTIDNYSYLVQTDIDMLIPPKLIQFTLDHLHNASDCFHCHFRYVESKEVTKWMEQGYNKIPWDIIRLRSVFHASGSWNGMSVKNWRKSNGFCEAIYYLGGPDTEFFRRSMKLGIPWSQDISIPLAHINHPRRRIPKQGKKNLSIAKRYPANHNWLFHRIPDICETNITKIAINQ